MTYGTVSGATLTTLCEFPVYQAHRKRSIRRAKSEHVSNFEGPDDYRRRLFLTLCIDRNREGAQSTIHEP